MTDDAQLGAWLDQGVDLFEQERFWHAHEAWEEAWRSCAPDERNFFQGLILLTAALHKLEQPGARPHSMLRLLGKARQRLRGYTPRHRDIDVALALEAIEDLRQEARQHLDHEAHWQARANRTALLQAKQALLQAKQARLRP